MPSIFFCNPLSLLTSLPHTAQLKKKTFIQALGISKPMVLHRITSHPLVLPNISHPSFTLLFTCVSTLLQLAPCKPRYLKTLHFLQKLFIWANSDSTCIATPSPSHCFTFSTLNYSVLPTTTLLNSNTSPLPHFS